MEDTEKAALTGSSSRRRKVPFLAVVIGVLVVAAVVVLGITYSTLPVRRDILTTSP